jgi:dihydrofolate reductase
VSEVALVVAHAANRVIGRDGGLPWHLPGDLARFKALTTGATVLMGRRTWESLPDAVRPLPGRRNLVLSRDGGFSAPGAERFASLEDALAAAVADRVFVIGGEAVYAAALPVADRVLATELEAEVEGDARFPELGDGWRLAEESAPQDEGGHTYRFRTYERA